MLEGWRSIRTINALREFRRCYNELSVDEKRKILDEMTEYLGDYAKTVVQMVDIKPPQAENKNKPLTRVRVRRRRS